MLTMADDGGSSGRLRSQYGVMPPGDVRKCIEALSDNDELSSLFEYRFESGELAGHSLGNLFLSASEMMKGNFTEAIKLAEKTLGIDDVILPVTETNVELVMKYKGSTIKGEYKILNENLLPKQFQPEIYLQPDAHLAPKAGAAIQDADAVVIAPGHLYTSVGPALLPIGMREALTSTRAKIIYVCNLANTVHQTAGFKIVDYMSEIERIIGKSGIIDYVVYNTMKIDERLGPNEQAIRADESEFKGIGCEFIGEETADDNRSKNSVLDKISHTRSTLKHDGSKVAKIIQNIA